MNKYAAKNSVRHLGLRAAETCVPLLSGACQTTRSTKCAIEAETEVPHASRLPPKHQLVSRLCET